MEIRINSLVDGSKDATGTVVIIDVLRACTTIPILLNNNAEEIIPVRTPEEARAYTKKGYVPIGEGTDGSVHNAFQYNNSPSEVYSIDFTGKRIVLRSNNATTAILQAKKASDIVLASFVNLDAIVEYILASKSDVVTLVPLGRLGEKGTEDELCASAIKSRVENSQYDFSAISRQILDCDCAKLVKGKLGKPEDVSIALQLNAYLLVPKTHPENGYKILKA